MRQSIEGPIIESVSKKFGIEEALVATAVKDQSRAMVRRVMQVVEEKQERQQQNRGRGMRM